MSKYPVKVLQIGEGNFLRGFIDWMFQSINDQGLEKIGVAVVQPRPGGKVHRLQSQNGSYHVVLEGLKNGKFEQEIRKVDCLQKLIDPYQDFSTYLAQASNPEICLIVSNTTEAGIAFDPKCKFNDQPALSFPGKLTQWLYERMKALPLEKLMVLPCELIENNGSRLREIVLQYVRLWDLPIEFENWINVHVIWYNTLVDRIVPGFPEDRASELFSLIGAEDSNLVMGELFHLLVLEGPEDILEDIPFKAAGLNVIISNNLNEYRIQKVRILNGTHTAMVPLGLLEGIETVKEFSTNKEFSPFLEHLIYSEIIPAMGPNNKALKAYGNAIIERFRNPALKHELKSIALNSISKVSVRVLPSIVDYEKRFGRLPEGLVLCFAAMIRFYKGSSNQRTLPIQDSQEVVETLRQFWENFFKTQNLELLEHLLSDKRLWGITLSQIGGLKQMIYDYLLKMEKHNLRVLVANIQSK